MVDSDTASLNNITNELILKYDENFNELYDKSVSMNSTITNKEEIIYKINDEIQEKERQIIILQNLLLYFFLISILIILYALKKIKLSMVIIISIVLFILFGIYIYYKIYNHITITQATKLFNNLKVEMKELPASIFGSVFKTPEYSCPTTCSQVSEEDVPHDMVYHTGSPTLNIDPQTNVWKYGDIPPDVFTTNAITGKALYNDSSIPNYNRTVQEENANEPKPFFGTTYPFSTYYKCSWLGGNKTYGLPNSEPNTYSSIPCSYRANYTETGRYICPYDPNINNVGIGGCDDVSVGVIT